MKTKNIKISTSDEKFYCFLTEKLDEGVNVTITITGDSMFPLWRHKRDTAILTNCDNIALKKYDIPLYRRATGQYVMHRIIKVNTNSYNLCGDAQTQVEYNVPKESIIAVVRAFTRKGKTYKCDNLIVKAYSTIWRCLLPFRGIILKVYIKLSKFEKRFLK